MAAMHSSSCAHGCRRPLLTYLRYQRLSSAAATNKVRSLRSEVNSDPRSGCHATSSRRSSLRSRNWDHGICWARLLSQSSTALPCKNFRTLAGEWSSNDGCDIFKANWSNSFANHRPAARDGWASRSCERRVTLPCLPAYSEMKAKPYLGRNVRRVGYIPVSSSVNLEGLCWLPAQGLIRSTNQGVRSTARGVFELLPIREIRSVPEGVLISHTAICTGRQSSGGWGNCTPRCMPGEEFPTGLWTASVPHTCTVPSDLGVERCIARDSGSGRGTGKQRRDLHSCSASRRRSGGTFGEDEEDEKAPKLSRNALKRVALQGVEWAEIMAKMSVKQIESIVQDVDLREEVPEAIALVKTLGIKTKNGRRRQFNYIGSLLRDTDPKLMEAAIAAAREGRSLTAAVRSARQVENSTESEVEEVAHANP